MKTRHFYLSLCVLASPSGFRYFSINGNAISIESLPNDSLRPTMS